MALMENSVVDARSGHSKKSPFVGGHRDAVAICANHRTTTLLELGDRADAHAFSGEDAPQWASTAVCLVIMLAVSFVMGARTIAE